MLFDPPGKYLPTQVAFHMAKSKLTPPLVLRLTGTIGYTGAMPPATPLPASTPRCQSCARPLTPATSRPFHDLAEGTLVLCLGCWEARNSTAWRGLSLVLPRVP